MKVKFTKDFANNWKAGDIVEVKNMGQDEVLVDDVALISLDLLLEHCVILSENEVNE